MPIYEFICQGCQNRFEVFFQSLNPNRITCPQCQGDRVERIFSVFGFSSGNKFVSSSSSDKACLSCTSRSCKTCGT